MHHLSTQYNLQYCLKFSNSSLIAWRRHGIKDNNVFTLHRRELFAILTSLIDLQVKKRMVSPQFCIGYPCLEGYGYIMGETIHVNDVTYECPLDTVDMDERNLYNSNFHD